MDLDIRTILFISAVNALVVGVATFITARAQQSKANDMRDWGIACLLQSAGWILIGLRGGVPELLSVVVGNTVLMMSYGLFYRALKEFNRERYFRPGPYVLVAAVFVMLCYFTFARPSMVDRAIVLALGAGVLFSLSARLVISKGREARKFSHLLTGGAFIVFVLVAAARVSYLLFVDRSMTSLFTKNPMQELLYATSP